jgi:hypothetical protein
MAILFTNEKSPYRETKANCHSNVLKFLDTQILPFWDRMIHAQVRLKSSCTKCGNNLSNKVRSSRLAWLYTHIYQMSAETRTLFPF